MKNTCTMSAKKPTNNYSHSATSLMSESREHTKKEMIDIRQNAKRELMETYTKLYGNK